MSPVVFGVLLPWLLVAVGCWLFYQLILQNGRILVRLEALEEKLEQVSAAVGTPPETMPGLPIGSTAPAFELPDLSGSRRMLAEFRGGPLLLIFFSPQCHFCIDMLADLAALATDGKNGRPVPLVITTGDAEANRRMMHEHHVACPVLREEDMKVSSQYLASGTPMGYLVDGQGMIASNLAVGAQAVLDLARPSREAADGRQEQHASRNGRGAKTAKGKANRGLHTSRLNRDGLKAGTPAPGFRLSRLEGGELSLEEYRGRCVLLVFTDPHCVPCDLLAPQLETLHRRRPDFHVVMVSRRDVEANRDRVKQHGLTLPVVLQRHWEISLLYGTFDTPCAYLIDAQGIVAKDVAVGVEAILGLVSDGLVPSDVEPGTQREGKEVMPKIRASPEGLRNAKVGFGSAAGSLP